QHLTTGADPWPDRESQPASGAYSWDGAITPTAAAPELKAGDRVRHSPFGRGVVVSCQPVRDDSEVVVAFRGMGVKKLLLSFARLAKVD
ncbi:MAG: hypothetical protein V3W01_00990, partial [Dehalococcoidales bacterium]